MTTPTTSIAWDLGQEMTRQFAVACDPATCESGWPGDNNVNREMVWLDDFTSEVEVPVMVGPARNRRNERITYVWNVRVAGRNDLPQAHVRTAELLAVLENFVADNQTFEDFEGVVGAEVTERKQSATRTPEGVFGYGQISIVVDTRLH